MTATLANLVNILGKKITLIDQRTGAEYQATVTDGKESWSRLRIQVDNSGTWFEPTNRELATIPNYSNQV